MADESVELMVVLKVVIKVDDLDASEVSHSVVRKDLLVVA